MSADEVTYVDRLNKHWYQLMNKYIKQYVYILYLHMSICALCSVSKLIPNDDAAMQGDTRWYQHSQECSQERGNIILNKLTI